MSITGIARIRALEGKSAANFIDGQRDVGKSGEFDGYNFPHSEEMRCVSFIFSCATKTFRLDQFQLPRPPFRASYNDNDLIVTSHTRHSEMINQKHIL